jgi:hypothetical protein
MSEQFFAQLDDNNVCLQVHVVTAEFMAENPDRYPGVWVETFYNLENKTYAGEGYIYNPTTEDFSPAPPDPTEQ